MWMHWILIAFPDELSTKEKENKKFDEYQDFTGE